MVVDDEALIALDVECALADAGFTVAVATSCAEANRFLKDHTPAAAVLDVRLPDGECHEAAITLADHGGTLRVIYRLGRGRYARSLCPWVTVLKPTEPAEVVRLLKAMATGRQQKMTG
ncbi:response regulator [Mesorhizobium sp. B2-3-4]|uniref:response regulator n=1 Tax=Mesorhizobium sp. B2-3-4 TaxID=2589959 RepID=UPI0015E28476|nr:response regulator [Mesorhizobium sp. B2-3-4]